jgi:hypothetical protein
MPAWLRTVATALTARGVLRGERDHPFQFGKWFVWAIFLITLTKHFGLLAPVTQSSERLWDGIASAVSDQADIATLNDQLRLVIITPELYRGLFDRHSPLDAGQLAGLVAGILRRNPKALFIDIDTDHHQFAGMRSLLTGLKVSDESLKKVVWVNPFTEPVKGKPNHLLGVWGGTADETVCHAAAPVKVDSDGRLREALLNTEEVNGLGNRLTFVHLAALALQLPKERPWTCPGGGKAEGPFAVRPRYVRYLGRLAHFREPAEEMFSNEPDDRFEGLVVFLGGDYSRDRYMMANGEEHPGVETVAAAALSIAGRKLAHEVHPAIDVLVDFLFAGFIAAAFHYLHPRWAFWSALFLGTLLCLSIAVAAYHFGSIMELAVLWFGLLFHNAVEAAEEAQAAGGSNLKINR